LSVKAYSSLPSTSVSKHSRRQPRRWRARRNPVNRYGFDPAKGKALLAAAGYTVAKPLSFKVMISTSGSAKRSRCR